MDPEAPNNKSRTLAGPISFALAEVITHVKYENGSSNLL